ncbi:MULTISPECIES: M20 metallopeptidase family protein [Pseudonocardia]|uniref:Hippurate hydrolase n=2 Tax=Pseudonocardia TaxID=1847 RepID=A0ABQ0S6R5_9PSEU|nr:MULTISPECIES: M20 family metallopeptidase [Pseudonocardia]OSY42021.1 putative hydrolase YxeP [Pseudonocardia autotrophica]TDN75210.1 hippurate hydrolase [Pseudonocardia autotrophica]BBF99155.1 hippurate hydrolase [Pseudonocardia autotrophica]GEC28592.1 hippurate hydrolase [Pseudonocardia saturnea]
MSITPASVSHLPDGLLARARALQPRTVALRRELHRAPELGLDLPRTRDAVLRSLQDLPVSVRTGRSCSSVVAVLEGARPGPTVLLRGDMDALPLQEDTGLDFSSGTDGAMHACGHDTHTAMLASAARLLAGHRDRIAGRVLLMFQPGEEGFHGARHMIDDGLLDDDPALAYALHISSTVPSGELHHRPGPIMAAADVLTVTVTGRGGHASAPQDACDPVPAAAAMVGGLQTMLTRRVGPHDAAVLTVARIQAGTTDNIIPETAELTGTLRTLSEPVRALLHTEIEQHCRHIALAHGCTAEVRIVRGYPVTVNDGPATAALVRVGERVLGDDACVPMVNPLMGAEDFSYVLDRVPGALAFLGARPPGTDPATAPPNHSNRVVFDEAAFPAGVAVYAGLALAALT